MEAKCKQCGQQVHYEVDGARCRPTHQEGHALASREYRRRRRLREFPPAARTGYLAALSEGAHPREAAEEVGVTLAKARGTARAEPAFGAAVDDALMRGRDESLVHGRASTYRHYRCRCPECREDHEASRGERMDA